MSTPAPGEAPAADLTADRLAKDRLVLAAYAAPALPLAVLTLPLYVVVPTHYATIGMPAALVGLVLLGVRVFDALIDPLAGLVADRHVGRFGRRRLWFSLGILPTALAAWFLFTPPASITPQAGALRLAGWGLLLSIGWTMMLVPYNAWGAELSTDYAGRSRVAAWRESVTFLGTLVALVLFGVLADTGRTLHAFALLVAIGLPLLAALTLWRVPEPPDRSRRRLPPREAVAHMLRNRPFLRLLAAFFLNSLANGLPATLFLLYVTQRLGLSERAAGLFLVLYVLSGIVAVPAWLALARRHRKHRIWCGAMLFNCLAFLPAPFLPEGAAAGFGLVCLLTGLAVGADLILPASMQADAIDVDTAASGEQRSGFYLAAWGLATKLALALAVGIAFPLLAASGFDAAPGGEKTAAGRFVLGLLYGGLPILFKLMAIGLIYGFPIDAAEQARLRAAIEAGASPADGRASP